MRKGEWCSRYGSTAAATWREASCFCLVAINELICLFKPVAVYSQMYVKNHLQCALKVSNSLCQNIAYITTVPVIYRVKMGWPMQRNVLPSEFRVAYFIFEILHTIVLLFARGHSGKQF
jgi:hypothetical protein